MNADFLHSGPKLSCPREHLDVDERPSAAKLWQQRIQQVATVYLEPAIHVAYRDPEKNSRHSVVHECVQAADDRVVARDTVAADDVGAVEHTEQNGQFTKIE